MPKKGLPDNFKLRHDSHYVEQLTSRGAGAPVGRMIPIDKLAPNPLQPRVEIGDLSEMVLSIREKGVLEPLLVRPSDVGGRFMIISGERRYRASLEVGLTELPCIEMDVDDRAVAEISRAAAIDDRKTEQPGLSKGDGNIDALPEARVEERP